MHSTSSPLTLKGPRRSGETRKPESGSNYRTVASRRLMLSTSTGATSSRLTSSKFWRLDELSAQQRDFHGKAQCLPAKEKLLLDTLQSDLLAHQVTAQALKTGKHGQVEREDDESRARKLRKINNPTTAEKKELEELLKKSHVHNRVCFPSPTPRTRNPQHGALTW